MTRVQLIVNSDPLNAVWRRVERPVLQELMAVALHYPICVVTGVAGWGKSAAVASWAGGSPAVWLRRDNSDGDVGGFLRAVEEVLRPHLASPTARPSPDGSGEAAVAAVAEAVCDWLGRFLHEDVVLVLDDLHGLSPDTDLARLVNGLCRHAPARLRIVLVSRQELPFSLDRLRGQGLVAEIHAPELAFHVSDVALLLEATVGLDPPGLPRRIWERTGGWPAAVYCAVEMLRGVPAEQRLARVEFIARPGERFHNFLTQEVLNAEPERSRTFLHQLSVLGEIRSAPGSAPDGAPDDVMRTLAELTRRGLVARSPDGSGRWSLVPPLADYFTYESDLSVTQRVRLHALAAQECIRRGAHADAVQHLVAAGDHEACVALLLRRGDALVSSGRADAVLEAGRLPQEHLQDPTVQRVLGRARQARGHWAAALECFQRAGLDGPGLEPALAWCAGLVAYSRGELRAVLALTDRAGLEREDTAEATRVLTLAAAAHRMSGNLPAAHAAKTRASAAARRSGEGRVRAALYQVMAMLDAAEGDHRQAAVHFSMGATSADAEDDLLQSLSIQICRAFHTLDQGAPRPALAEVQSSLRASRECGDPFLTAHALTTSGRAKVRLGMLDSAQADLAGAVDAFQRISSRFLAWPLTGLGDLYRVRGQPVRARAAYEEALALAEPGGDVLATASALIGLAHVRAGDDLALARELADRAVALGEGLREVRAFLVRGWVALLGGDSEAATADAARAGAAARRRRDDPGLAEAITLTALAAPDPVAESALLSEAIHIWHEAGCRVEEAGARIVAASVGATIPDLGLDRAYETLRECGVDVQSWRTAGPWAAVIRSMGTVSIRTLGVFRVLRNGTLVPAAEWRSKKARDLLKILLAHRRPVARERLMELLWPMEDPGKASKRLSVLLSTVRAVLGFSRQQPDDGPLVTNRDAVWLDLGRLDVDIEHFMTAATDALRMHETGGEQATAHLAAAEARYAGNFLEDEPYLDWADPLREEARALHVSVLRALTQRMRAAGDVDRATRYALRLFQHDPYDEQAHLELVGALLAAGRRGEARRRYRAYVRCMTELDARPAPFPSPAGDPEP